MTIKTRPVSYKLTTASGAPADRAKITITLTALSVVEDEIVVLQTVTDTADENGEGVVYLVPNALMDSGAQYTVTARRGGETVMESTAATLPDGPSDEEVELTAILNQPPPDPLPVSTDNLAEGSSNLYFTAARVRAVLLTGLSTATNAVITASDSILTMAGKLQAQINNLGGGVWGTISGNLPDQDDLKQALDAKADASALTNHTSNASNPHSVTKAQVGLGNADNTADTAKPVSIAQQAALDLKANISSLGTAAALAVDTDGTLAANSDTRIPSQKAVKAYADQLIAAADVMVFKGVRDCSASPNYPAADAGWTYRVSVAGKIGGASGQVVEVGDLLLCLVDGTASGTQAAVGANWSIAQTNIDGAVIGPTSAVDGNVVLFNGTTGKIIKDSGLTLAGNNTGDETGARIAVLLHAASAKTTLVDADEVSGTDSAASFGLIRTTWGNVKAFLKTYFDTLYQAVLVSGTNIKTVNSNSLLGSGNLTIAATPAGSTTQAQINIGGTLVGAPGLLHDTATTRTTLGGDLYCANLKASADPTNRVLDVNASWVTNLNLNLSSSAGSVTVGRSGTGVSFDSPSAGNQVMAAQIAGTTGNIFTIRPYDVDAVPNRQPQTLLIRGSNANAGGAGISGQLITGGNVSLAAGAGASSATGAAAGGSFFIDGGQGYGTGAHGDIYLNNTRGNLRIQGGAFFNARADLKSYTVATLPAAGAAAGVIYVSDAGGNGPCLAISNGTNWKRCDNVSTTVV